MAITKKAEKRIRIPDELKIPFSQMVADEAYLRAADESKTIIGLFDTVLPAAAYPHERMYDVYCGDSLFTSISDVLRSNVTGAIGVVNDKYYKPIVEFGAELIRSKNCGTSLFTGAADMPHLRRCFDSVIEYMEHGMPRDPEDPFADYEATRAARYGRELMVEMSSEFSRAPVAALVYFAIEYFDEIGALNATCAYLADAFSALEESVTISADKCGNNRIPPDTPDLRRKWSDLLESVCSDWK